MSSLPKNITQASYSSDRSGFDPPNPLLEALPFYTREQIREKLSDSRSFFQTKWREQRPEYRIGLFRQVHPNFFIPRECHLDLAMAMRNLMRAHYVTTPCLECVPSDSNRTNDVDQQHARNIGLFGLPGTGKTIAIRKCVSLFPRMILHTEYCGRPFRMLQTPCLRIICTTKGGAKTLYGEILSTHSDLVGNYYVPSKTTAESERKIKQLVTTSGIGVIIIDEIQNVNSQGRFTGETLAALTRLNEHAGVSLILAGDDTAGSLFSHFGHSSRRASGYPAWSRFEKDPEWEQWLEHVLQYHLTKRPLEYSSEISELFYNYSQGISDDVIALFLKSQELALKEHREEVLPRDLKAAITKHLSLRTETLENLRKKIEVRNDKRRTLERSAAIEERHDTAGPIDDPRPNYDQLTGAAENPGNRQAA